MKYKEFVPCRKCKGNGKTIPRGYYRDTETRNGIEYKIVKECLHHKAWRLKEAAYQQFINNGFNKDYFDNSDNDYIGTESIGNIIRLKNYVERFIDEKVSSSILYFYGKNGTQKTVTANWIGSYLIQANYDVQYISMNNLLDLLWNSQRDEEQKKRLLKYEDCNLVIIDEAFDKEKSVIWGSGKQLGLIDDFIRERINYNKGIIFISNKEPSQIKAEGFSISIQDLIDRELKKRDSLFIFKDNYFDNLGTIPERVF